MEGYSGKILLISDSCFVTPGKHFEGLLSRGKGKENCLRAQFCLAISDDGKHIFGITDFQVLSNPIKKRHPELDDESEIWLLVAKNTLKLLHTSKNSLDLIKRSIFITDREGDEFDLFDFLVQSGLGLIIRSQYNRNIHYDDQDQKLFEIFDLSKKHGSPYIIEVQKEGKGVSCEVQRSALKDVEVVPPSTLGKSRNNILLNLVSVQEIAPMDKPVSWRLWTTEDISNPKLSEFIVTSYTHRWKIEEVNKAAKTGVRVEDRQFTELDHFLPFLGMAFVIAWRIVALRTVCEISPDASINEGFTEEEQDFLETIAQREDIEMVTVSDGISYIARLGGFTGSYTRPGQIILWRGWMRFYERVEGFILARGRYFNSE